MYNLCNAINMTNRLIRRFAIVTAVTDNISVVLISLDIVTDKSGYR